MATHNIIIRDDVNNSVNKLCGEQLQKQFDFPNSPSAASGIHYKFKGRIVLDGGNGANASIKETC